jgi:hypothetical protein
LRRSRRQWLITGVLFTALTAGAGIVALAEAKRYVDAPTRIAIRAEQIRSFDNRDPALTRFGLLEFRGGLALTADNANFGGMSALHMESDGSHFVALTDRGSWLTGRIVYRDGYAAGIADAVMAPVLGADGRSLPGRGWYDTESLAADGGIFYAGIERAEQIVRFDYGRHGVRARGHPLPVPDDFRTFTRNKGLECLAMAPAKSTLAGTLIAITEHSLDATGNHRAFLLKGARAERFSVRRSGGFDVSDCVILPPGDLLLLERSYSVLSGVAMRIRRIPLASMMPAATVDGQIVIAVDLAYQIDNMEGIGLHRNARGETILTLVSDDNFSAIQRNLLLQFALLGE